MGGENLIDMTGEKYGYLTIIKRGEDKIYKSGRRKPRWWCLCDCQLEKPEGERKLKLIIGESIRSGLVVSCGCHRNKLVSQRNRDKKQYNKYDLTGEYGIGYTSKGEEFYFDLEDYDKIKDYCWHMDDKKYVKTHIDGKHISFHRVVMNITDLNIDIDHIKHINYDNRKSQLRIATSSQNQQNRWIQSNNTSGYPGVHKKGDSWEACITVNKKTIHLGVSKNKEDAIKLRKEAEENTLVNGLIKIHNQFN